MTQTGTIITDYSKPKVSKRIFRQWIIEVIMEGGKMTLDNRKKAASKANDILKFAEDQNLLSIEIIKANEEA